MKRILAILGVTLIGVMLFSPLALAQEDFEIEPPLEATTIPALIDEVINFIFLVGVAVAPVMILVGAFYFMTAAGNPERVSKAKRIIMWTLIGVVILYMADVLISVIRSALGVAD